jgi:hypothetical protein
MGANGEAQNLLSSWKEIASYLGCTVRTCHRWEQAFRLPIHRMDGAKRSRVFAYREEIDRWRELHTNNGMGPSPKAEEHDGRAAGRRRLVLASGLLVAGAAAAFFLLFGPLAPGEPAGFRIEGPTFVVLDAKGRELWRHATGLLNLESDGTYRAHSQFKRRTDYNPAFPYLVIRDIDRDRHAEVLFMPVTQDETNEGSLACFDHRGRMRWRYLCDRSLTCGERTYAADFRPRGFVVENLDSDEDLEILAIFLHRPSWPTQLAVLDTEGRLTGEFWNAGHLADLLVADVDRDGRRELVVAGNNNESRKGFLAVFDPADVSGGSPAGGEFDCEGVGPGSEKAYVLFPRTDVDLRDYPFEAIQRIEMAADGRLVAMANVSGLLFEMGPGLELRDIIFSHAFIQKHDAALAEGRVTSRLDGAYKDALMTGLRYWDGEKWTDRPAMNERASEAASPAASPR